MWLGVNTLAQNSPYVDSATPSAAIGRAWCQRAFLRICPHCGGRRRRLTAIQEPAAIRKVLAAMGLSADVPELAAARSPPGEVGIEFSG